MHLVHAEKFLFEDVELVLDILHVPPEVCFNIECLATANLCKSFLDCLSDFLREFQCCDAVSDLNVRGVQVDAEDHFCTGREHGLTKDLGQQGVVLRLEWALEGRGK